MAEERELETIEIAKPKGSKWFRKVPREILLSPGGMVLIFLAALFEMIDLIPLPFLDQLWELPADLFFSIFLIIIAKLPVESVIIPFLIERIPLISDITPTWLIKLFM